jgi:general secretion pathway protein I
MVALALLAGALMAIVDLTGSSVRNHVTARALTTATLLARGKMAEIEERFEDQGFKSSDEVLTGDFDEEGHPDIKWRVEAVRPGVEFSADQIVGALAGDAEGGAAGLMDRLGGQAGASAAGAGATSTLANPFMGVISGQVTAFGERIKESLREVRLTVSWKEGKEDHGFTVATHLVVLCPKTASGRGDWADACTSRGLTAPPTPGGGFLPPGGGGRK